MIQPGVSASIGNIQRPKGKTTAGNMRFLLHSADTARQTHCPLITILRKDDCESTLSPSVSVLTSSELNFNNSHDKILQLAFQLKR